MPRASAVEHAQFLYQYLAKGRRIAGADYANGALEELPGIQFLESLLHRFGPSFSEDAAEKFFLEIHENAALMDETQRQLIQQVQDDGEVDAELAMHLFCTDPAAIVQELLEVEECVETRQLLIETETMFSSEVGDPQSMWATYEKSNNRFTQQYVSGALHKISSNTSSGGRIKKLNAKTTPEKAFIKECWEDWKNGKTTYKNQEHFIDDMSQKVEVLKCNSTTVNGWIREWQHQRNVLP